MPNIVARLDDMRARFFVGRSEPMRLMREVLSDDTPERVAYVHGMGGIGKSELLRRFAQIARKDGWEVHLLDCRDLPGNVDELDALISQFSTTSERVVIALDAFEQLQSSERRVRDEVFAKLTRNCRLILATRQAPNHEWRAHSGWSMLTSFIELTDLTRGEAAEYLERRGVREKDRGPIVEALGGLPLALALAADAASSGRSAAAIVDDPLFIDSLLQGVLDEAPSTAHQEALITAAIAPTTTMDLLAKVAPSTSSQELFAWLRARPYFTALRRGLAPHDVVRAALVTHTKWKSPTLFRQLLIRTAQYYHDHLRHHPEQTAIVPEANRLLGLVGIVPYAADAHYSARYALAEADDLAFIQRVAKERLGPECLAALMAWRDHNAFELHTVWRGGVRTGFFCTVRPERLSPTELEEVPGLGPLVRRFGPPAAPWLVTWLWADARHRHGVSATQTQLMAWHATELNWLQDTAISATCLDATTFWAHGLGTHRTKPRIDDETAFELDGCQFAYLVKTHEEPSPFDYFWALFGEWLQMLQAPPAHSPPMLSEGEFRDLLKTVLKRADRADALADHPFVELLVAERRADDPSPAGRARALIALLREISAEFRESPRDGIYDEILVRTYFEPGPKQQAIAAELNLSFGSYRRYLGIAIERLATSLQQMEFAARVSAADEATP